MLKSKKGFTLVELVVVIAILGILAALAIPRFMDATASARGAKIVADLRTIDSAVVLYEVRGAETELTADNDGVKKLVTERLLVSEPIPPTGKAIYPDGTDETVAKDAKYVLKKGAAATDYFRGALNDKTADDLTQASTKASK